MAADELGASFEEFVSVRWAALYRTAYLMARDRFEAEDVVQATLVNACAAWRRVQRAASPDAYVRRILVNEFLTGRRRRRREDAHGPLRLVPEPSPPEVPESTVVERLGLWEHVRALPPRQRAVVVLRYYEDYSERQIAEALGCSPGTVKSQGAAAMRTLQTRLDAERAAEEGEVR